MSEKIIKVIINRKADENNTVILLTDTKTNKARKFVIDNTQQKTREYMTYLVASELSNIENEINANPNPNSDDKYVIIASESLRGINIAANRLHYISTKTNKSGTALSDNFVNNVQYIHFMLEKLNDRVYLTTTNLAVPHEYNGKRVGTALNAEAISKSWKLMDTIVPPEVKTVKDFELE